MDPSLRGYELAVLQDAGPAPSDGAAAVEAVAGDLRAVSDAVSRSTPLAQVLTDELVAKRSKHAVVTDLFSGRIGAPALRVVQRAISTEYSDVFLSALVDAAEVARQFSDLGPEQFEAEQPLEGRLAARRLAAGYATCVFEDVAQVADIERVEHELFSFARVVEQAPALRSALSDSYRPVGDRRKLVSELLSGRANAVTIRLARVALYGRVRDPVGSFQWMAERAAEARGWRVARVTSARELDSAEREEVGAGLRELTGAPVELLVEIDPELLGGVVISIGNLLIDSTAEHRLEELEEQMLGSSGALRAG